MTLSTSIGVACGFIAFHVPIIPPVDIAKEVFKVDNLANMLMYSLFRSLCSGDS